MAHTLKWTSKSILKRVLIKKLVYMGKVSWYREFWWPFHTIHMFVCCGVLKCHLTWVKFEKIIGDFFLQVIHVFVLLCGQSSIISNVMPVNREKIRWFLFCVCCFIRLLGRYILGWGKSRSVIDMSHDIS